VYVCSKARHFPWWQALRAAGLDIRAGWIDWPFNHDLASTPPSQEAWALHWSGCVSGASEADILLFYAAADERQCGALIELGAALASGRRCFVVSPYQWTVAHHPRCRTFSTLAAAVEAIVAMQKGEKARPG
jgi:hypothetical protein